MDTHVSNSSAKWFACTIRGLRLPEERLRAALAGLLGGVAGAMSVGLEGKFEDRYAKVWPSDGKLSLVITVGLDDKRTVVLESNEIQRLEGKYITRRLRAIRRAMLFTVGTGIVIGGCMGVVGLFPEPTSPAWRGWLAGLVLFIPTLAVAAWALTSGWTRFWQLTAVLGADNRAILELPMNVAPHARQLLEAAGFSITSTGVTHNPQMQLPGA